MNTGRKEGRATCSKKFFMEADEPEFISPPDRLNGF